MKCQHCDKPATVHITELTGTKPVELHMCADHAKQYLSETEPGEANAGVAETLAQQLVASVGQTAEELAKLDQVACPICGITFLEFRNKGRLGCPHDYVYFQKQVDPLILNIHGGSLHTGKRPPGASMGTDHRTKLIRLRREMKEAVVKEEYERASEIRDEIRRIESTP